MFGAAAMRNNHIGNSASTTKNNATKNAENNKNNISPAANDHLPRAAHQKHDANAKPTKQNKKEYNIDNRTKQLPTTANIQSALATKEMKSMCKPDMSKGLADRNKGPLLSLGITS